MRDSKSYQHIYQRDAVLSFLDLHTTVLDVATSLILEKNASSVDIYVTLDKLFYGELSRKCTGMSIFFTKKQKHFKQKNKI